MPLYPDTDAEIATLCPKAQYRENESNAYRIGHFTVVCLVTWLMNASEVGGDLALIQTSLLFSCKYQLVSIRKT